MIRFAQVNSGRGTHTDMGRPTGKREIAAYLVHEIKRLVASKSVTAAEVARKAGITPGQLSQVLSGKRGVGTKSLYGFANVLGESLGSIEQKAERWASAHPEAVAPPKPSLPEWFTPALRHWLDAHPDQDPLAPEVMAFARSSRGQDLSALDEIGEMIDRIRYAHAAAGLDAPADRPQKPRRHIPAHTAKILKGVSERADKIQRGKTGR